MTYPIRISTQMASFLQIEPTTILPRIELTKLVWNYIKINKLQCIENRKQIIPNKELSELFHLSPGQTLNLFTLFNHITRHVKRIKRHNI